MDADKRVTFGGAAVWIGRGVTCRHISRLASRKEIPFETAGHIRLVRVSDLDDIRRACERAGCTRSGSEAPLNA